MSDSTPPAGALDPIYADRMSGERFLNATNMINAYLGCYAQRTVDPGINAPAGSTDETTVTAIEVATQLDESGYAQLTHGSAVIGINVLEDHGVLMVFAPIMAVPDTRREELYRTLLELSFITTSDAAFAIDKTRDEVVVRCFRRLSALDYEEFEDIVETVSRVADEWDDKLVREFGRD